MIKVRPIRDEIRTEELFVIHLKVLKHVLNGELFERIRKAFNENFKKTDYLNIMKRSDSLSFNAKGTLIGAYPISPVASPFKIDVEGIGIGYAMCAIDALGVAYTFGARTSIETRDPATSEPIRIVIDPNLEKQIQYDFYVSYTKPPSDLKKGSCAEVQCPKISFYYSCSSIPSDLSEIFTFEKALDHAKKRFNPNGMKNNFKSVITAI